MEKVNRFFLSLVKDKSPIDKIRVQVLFVVLLLAIFGETIMLIADLVNSQSFVNNIIILIFLFISMIFLFKGMLNYSTNIFLLPFSVEFFRSFFTNGGIVIPAIPLFILLVVLAIFLLDLLPAIVYICLMLLIINLDIPLGLSANFTVTPDPGSLLKRFLILDLITIAICVVFVAIFHELKNNVNELVQHSENLDELVKAGTSDLAKANKKLKELAITDSLTGLNNRRNLFELAEIELTRAQRYQQPFSIGMLDLDHFKKINDQHGHLVGDEVLQAVAKRVRESIREVDLVGRFGGDEFAVLMPTTGLTEAILTSRRLCKEVSAKPIEIDQHQFTITINIGVSSCKGERAITIGTLFDQADQALYAAKRNKENCVAQYSK
ncbi:MAG: GGDEF domain-containing protein [Chloroflexota bacterium]